MSFPPQLHYQNRGREKTSVRSACSRTGGRNTYKAHNDGRCNQVRLVTVKIEILEPEF